MDAKRPRGRLRRWAGRLAIAAGICGMTLFIVVRAARATVYERLMQVGDQMAAFLDDADTTSKPRTVLLNGEKVHAATGVTQQTVADVIKFYGERYGQGDAGMMAAMEQMVGQPGAPKELKAAVESGIPYNVTHVSGDGGGDKGLGAFVDLGRKEASPEEMAKRLAKLADTGQLSAFAKFYYVYARRQGDQTRFFLMWTDQAFNVNRLTGDEGGDVGGRDFKDVPRYPGATRSFHAEEPAKGYSMAAYECPGDPAAVEAFYRARMVDAGWQIDPHFARAAAEASKRAGDGIARAQRFVRSDANLAFAFEPNDDGGTRLLIVGRQ